MNAGHLRRDTPEGWRVRYLHAEYVPSDPTTPRYEVFPPDGYRFWPGGEHSRIERYARNVRAAFAAQIVRCPDDCDCST